MQDITNRILRQMNSTRLISTLFKPRQKATALYATQAEVLQHKVFCRLMKDAAHTEWGLKYGYKDIKRYQDFQRVPIQTYEEIKPYVERMRHGEKDVLWRGEVQWFAKSSGTTNDKSKFIPVSREGLHDIHYAGGMDAVALYLQQNPESRFFSGKGLILGGSHAPNYNVKRSLVGDLSAILIENVNPLVNLIRVPDKKIALLSDFEEKVERITRATMNQNVTNLSGVPSWMMAVLKHILEVKGTDNLAEVWPDLEVFFHGGVAFTPYREQYKQLIRSDKMHYMETYNASEGFFGIQDDPADQSLLLMQDYGVFYEFIPMSEVGMPNPTILPLEAVETGKNYAMVITTSGGLWRYQIGDTVRFTSLFPHKFVISGRTKHYINAFGEELMVDNADKAISKVSRQTGAIVKEYTAAPLFMLDKAKGRHQWFIEFEKMPPSMEEFASLLDKTLQELNSDYEAKRYKEISLQPLEITIAHEGAFYEWLKEKGKLGGQHKIPRLSNDRTHIEQLLAINKQLS